MAYFAQIPNQIHCFHVVFIQTLFISNSRGYSVWYAQLQQFPEICFDHRNKTREEREREKSRTTVQDPIEMNRNHKQQQIYDIWCVCEKWAKLRKHKKAKRENNERNGWKNLQMHHKRAYTRRNICMHCALCKFRSCKGFLSCVSKSKTHILYRRVKRSACKANGRERCLCNLWYHTHTHIDFHWLCIRYMCMYCAVQFLMDIVCRARMCNKKVREQNKNILNARIWKSF